MTPATPVQNVGHIHSARSEFHRQFALENATFGVTAANFADLFCGQFDGKATKPASVRRVLRLRAPAKVRERIVFRVSVKMPALHTIGPLSDERLQYKPVQKERMTLAVARQVHAQISTAGIAFPVYERFHLPPASTDDTGTRRPQLAPQSSIIPNPVAGESGDIAVLNASLSLHAGLLGAGVKGPAGVISTASGSAHFTSRGQL